MWSDFAFFLAPSVSSILNRQKDFRALPYELPVSIFSKPLYKMKNISIILEDHGTFAFIFQSIGKGKKKMLNQRQIDRMLTKLERFEHTLERCYFEKVGELDMRAILPMAAIMQSRRTACFGQLKKAGSGAERAPIAGSKGSSRYRMLLPGRIYFCARTAWGMKRSSG